MTSGTNDAANESIRDGEDRWATARRVASDDHPVDCPCVRDHLENAFLLGMVEGEERASAPTLAEEHRLLAGIVQALIDGRYTEPCNQVENDSFYGCTTHLFGAICPVAEARDILDQIDARKEASL